MCPWKNGEQVTAQWVIPGWPEADEHLTCRLQERVHDTQDSRRVGEMLKGVQGNDDVRKLLRRRYEETSILDTVLSAFCLAAWRRSSRISIPITRWAPLPAISTASAPAILVKNSSPIRPARLALPFPAAPL